MSSYYELPANASEDVLRLKIDEVNGKLLSLNISNCIVAEPEGLLSLLPRLQYLQSLSCIACPLRASVLLEHLLTSLHNVAHLDFSFVGTEHDAKEELAKILQLKHVHKDKETQVRTLYAEVAADDNIEVLNAFVRYCPHVTDFHLHFVHLASYYDIVTTFASVVKNVRSLEVVTTTCEALTAMQSSTAAAIASLPDDPECCLDIFANMVYQRKRKCLNYAPLQVLRRSTDPILPDEPVVLVAFNRADFDASLLNVVRSCQWSDLQSLCILDFSPIQNERTYPTVGATHNAAFRQFFGRFCNIVELNVNSLHFDDGIDFTELLDTPTVLRLRALSLAPCGLQKSGAMHRLALGTSDIEDLDVRLNIDGRHSSCNYCSKELLLDPEDVSAFGEKSGRLTLSNVPNLASLNFLKSCPVANLRFIDVSERPRFDFKALASSVHHSNTLLSLVVRLASIDLDTESLKNSLCPARALERVCLLSKTKLRTSAAERIVEAVASQLQSILYLHIHYVDIETGRDTSVTWMRLPEGDAGAQPRRGKVMSGKPCIMCSTQTFIALVKPRRRDL
ncbi:uncharacterized protein LOC119405110 [Rhipicephalus sanguineus]|uniref:Uncharacterized protein n=1 Tax=Rhipicephalus sanguineus TaxID=34632 RepID=A0A9D4PE58_RHISA|nr:uncharacterized protein LOC119405110 [Rhipicephalus sanguineus]KAH7935789.1 hypothetical protein HPB52_013588 [Rhipicephalus sanguineus]